MNKLSIWTKVLALASFICIAHNIQASEDDSLTGTSDTKIKYATKEEINTIVEDKINNLDDTYLKIVIAKDTYVQKGKDDKSILTREECDERYEPISGNEQVILKGIKRRTLSFASRHGVIHFLQKQGINLNKTIKIPFVKETPFTSISRKDLVHMGVDALLAIVNLHNPYKAYAESTFPQIKQPEKFTDAKKAFALHIVKTVVFRFVSRRASTFVGPHALKLVNFIARETGLFNEINTASYKHEMITDAAGQGATEAGVTLLNKLSRMTIKKALIK